MHRVGGVPFKAVEGVEKGCPVRGDASLLPPSRREPLGARQIVAGRQRERKNTPLRGVFRRIFALNVVWQNSSEFFVKSAENP